MWTGTRRFLTCPPNSSSKPGAHSQHASTPKQQWPSGTLITCQTAWLVFLKKLLQPAPPGLNLVPIPTRTTISWSYCCHACLRSDVPFLHVACKSPQSGQLLLCSGKQDLVPSSIRALTPWHISKLLAGLQTTLLFLFTKENPPIWIQKASEVPRSLHLSSLKIIDIFLKEPSS